MTRPSSSLQLFVPLRTQSRYRGARTGAAPGPSAGCHECAWVLLGVPSVRRAAVAAPAHPRRFGTPRPSGLTGCCFDGVLGSITVLRSWSCGPGPGSGSASVMVLSGLAPLSASARRTVFREFWAKKSVKIWKDMYYLFRE